MFPLPDIAVVDMSDVCRQPSLFYHLGVRESFDMANNVILYHDTDPDTAQSLKVRADAVPSNLLGIKLSQSYSQTECVPCQRKQLSGAVMQLENTR